MFRILLTTVSAVAVVTAVSASAGEIGAAGNSQVTIQQAASMMSYSAGNDTARVSVAPNWSDELGWSVRGSAGSYLDDAVAMGVIVEYGDNKQEYLANLGFQITDAMSLIGTVGNLAETKEFVADSGKDKASQMEYGLSLKQSLQDGMGFEINGYGVNAKASNDAIETGRLYGAEGLLAFGLADTTMIKLGGGYEWLKWETTNEKNNHWSGRAEINQRLTDDLGLQGEARLGASERSYRGGLNLNVTDNSLLGFHYTQIEGRNGIADDKRAEVSFTYSFGGNPTNIAAADISTPDQTIKAASLATGASHNSLLLDVMKRPGYLPQRVLARSEQTASLCEASITNLYLYNSYYDGFRFDAVTLDPGAWFQVYVNGNLSPLTTDYDTTFTHANFAGSRDIYFHADTNHPELFNEGDTVRLVIIFGDGSCADATADAGYEVLS